MGRESDCEGGENANRPTLPTKTIYFRFRSRILSATATQVDGVHANVLRLQINHSYLALAVRALLDACPSGVQTWFRSRFPEWCLPTTIIFKKEKEHWNEEFDTERAAYDKLRCLQGLVIPVLYGQIEYDGTRALLLSDVGGQSLAEPEAILPEHQLRPLVDQAFQALAELRFTHDDLKLDNFRLVNGGTAIMVVDLELVNDYASVQEARDHAQWELDFLMDRYQGHFDFLHCRFAIIPIYNAAN
ncbi:hypothetical protein F4861DRAFT_534839 [Xylaria intraflava]|nr:hypothetical protein F4861DRAFT_534839 [Xylaria intraflava]